MTRENFKRRTREEESTDACLRGGSAHSSEEAAEMQRSKGAELSKLKPPVNFVKTKEELEAKVKPFTISKQTVYHAYLRIRANKGTYGVDGESLEMFEKNLKDNLYKIWNRMSSGSYMPPAVRRTYIPKKGGGERPLGIPTVSDRIAQMVVKMHLEPQCESVFHENSYAYRPNRSAHMAVEQARERCFHYSWVIDIDIKGFFDSISHNLMMKAVERHTQETWILLYIERWLKAPVQLEDGEMEKRECGTPQGSVISPLLANLYLHYAFDKWMDRNIPYAPFERYADDMIVHCMSKVQAQYVKQQIEKRLAECGLKLHPEKTRIVYCKYGKSKRIGGGHPFKSFDFLGFTFMPRKLEKLKKGVHAYWGFTPAISSKAEKSIMDEVRGWELGKKISLDLKDIAKWINPSLHGWIHYYGKFRPSELQRVFNMINFHIVKWMKKKYKITSKRAGYQWLSGTAKKSPELFAHWKLLGYTWVGQ